MARTPSNMLPLGTKSPSFELRDTVSGQTLSFDQIHGKEGTGCLFSTAFTINGTTRAIMTLESSPLRFSVAMT